jgi:uncharacterized protein (DUF302 family)
MKKLFRSIGSFLLLVCLALPAQAADLLTVRSQQNFEEAMSTLQSAIAARGYRVSRVQRVDVGLEAKGYKTDRYRVVFYAKPGQLEQLADKYPTLIPYLPLNVAIFAEGGNTILAAPRPSILREMFPQPELQPIFEGWEKDVTSILDEVRETH